MSDDDSRAQKLVNITLTNYFKQRALEVEETGKPPQSAVSPAESAVFNECRDQALTRGIAGSLGSALPTALFFRFATKLQQIKIAPVLSAAVIGGFWAALSNSRGCMINFLSIPEPESAVAGLCREALKEEVPNSALWKEVQENIKSLSGKSNTMASDYTWKREDAILEKVSEGQRKKEESGKLLLSARKAVEISQQQQQQEEQQQNEADEEREKEAAMAGYLVSVDVKEEPRHDWASDDNNFTEEDANDNDRWMNNDDRKVDERDRRRKPAVVARRALRVDEEYDRMYQGDLEYDVESRSSGSNIGHGSGDVSRPTTWAEIRAHRQRG